MLFASLGSGSAGNGMLVRLQQGHEQLTVLVDCGFNLRELEERLRRFDLTPELLSAILVTHEHQDHAGGVGRLAARFNLPVYLTHGTWQAVRWPNKEKLDCRLIDGYQAFQIGGLRVQPYPVPHDAREPAQFVFSVGTKRLGLLTDAGCHTAHISLALKELDGIVLECNHDSDLLRNSSYPVSLKARISSTLGHLSNATAARILQEIIHPKLQHVVAAHLSLQNNTPEHAFQALQSVIKSMALPPQIHIACQEKGFGWLEIK